MYSFFLEEENAASIGDAYIHVTALILPFILK